MRLLILAATAAFLTGATGEVASNGNETGPAAQFDNPAYRVPPAPWTDVPDIDDSERCADEIRRARAEAGLPQIDRKAAQPDDAMLLWAVDHRRGDCPVLVPAGRPGDIRPVPDSKATAGLVPLEK